MKKTSSDSPDIIASKRSGPQPGAHGQLRTSTISSLQPDHVQAVNTRNDLRHPRSEPASLRSDISKHARPSSSVETHVADQPPVSVSEKLQDSLSSIDVQNPPASSGKEERSRTVVGHMEVQVPNFSRDSANHHDDDEKNPKVEDKPADKKRTVAQEIRRSFWLVVTHSWVNVLLVFVPVGIIIAQIDGIHGGVVFGINAIAIIPLAGLLGFATESVASKMGDALGALLNVTFGNAVELIIFIIALAKDEIRIVQASLLGSILANLLLILGMCFFFGGLRYREQVYNSTVTQMSACLLSLSVISLVLPTAFHASFADSHKADDQSLKISRGTSVILLIVYIIYLLFQLKSHAYMYQSTPQHIVDAESVPGPAAAWLDASSSDSSSSDSSDSDDSRYSRDTMKRRVKKVLRAGRIRRSSGSSTEHHHDLSRTTTNTSRLDEAALEHHPASRPAASRSFMDHHADGDDEGKHHRHGKGHSVRSFRKKHRKRRHHRRESVPDEQQPWAGAAQLPNGPQVAAAAREGEPRRLDFAISPPQVQTRTDAPVADGEGNGNSNGNGNGNGSGVSSNMGNGASRIPFPGLRQITVRDLAPTVFVQKPQADAQPTAPSGPVPRVRLGIRRTNSLPDRLHQYQFRAPGAMLPARIPLSALDGAGGYPHDHGHDEEHLSRWASVVLLLVTTGLVAACAEFLVGSIQEVTSSSSLGEAFIGLILLPIVGNAAEHVTALTVAMKNKMDLAIGVAVGSSIQIAIFVTPLVVILGWAMGKDMTLYFTLFETVCLFVSAFMVNFLVLDGRSNYLEGALLCAVYSIIGVVAFFYPAQEEASAWGS